MKMYWHETRCLMVALILCLSWAGAAQARNWFVSPSGANAKTGVDWDNAADLAGVVAGMSAGDVVYLTSGTYPMSSFSLDVTGIIVLDNQTWMGGYDPGATGTTTETTRDLSSYETILDAEGASGAARRHVYIGAGRTGLLFDGITFYNGHWESTSGDRSASIAYGNGSSDGVFRDCKWLDCVGGDYGGVFNGAANLSGTLDYSFDGCIFENCQTTGAGWGTFGRIHCTTGGVAQIDFTNCIFSKMIAPATSGAILMITAGDSHVVNFKNSTFANCTEGSILEASNISGEISNNIIANADGFGDVIFDCPTGSTMIAKNNLFSGAASYFDGIQLAGLNIMTTEAPGFVDGSTSGQDYRLTAVSMAIDRGCENGVDIDIADNSRPNAGISDLPDILPARPDMGAYEAAADVRGADWFVAPNGTGTGTSWADATSLTYCVNNIGDGETVLLASGNYPLTTLGVNASPGIQVGDGQFWIGGHNPADSYAYDPTDYPSVFDAEGSSSNNSRRHLSLDSAAATFCGIDFINGYWDSLAPYRGGSLGLNGNPVAEFHDCGWENNLSLYGAVIGADSNRSTLFTLRFYRCRFEANYANGYGSVARIHYADTSSGGSDLLFENCLFSENDDATASGYAAIIMDNGAKHTITMRHCTWANTKALRYYDVGYAPSTVVADITNNLFADMDQIGGSSLYLGDNASGQVENNVWEYDSGGNYLYPTALLSATNVQGGTAGFVNGDSAPYDYRLTHLSSALDMAMDTGVSSDIDGTTRSLRAAADSISDDAPAYALDLRVAQPARPDVGCYEAPAGTATPIYIAPSARGDADGADWDNAIDLASVINRQAGSGVNDQRIGYPGAIFLLEETTHTLSSSIAPRPYQVWIGGYDATTHAWNPDANPTVIEGGGSNRLIRCSTGVNTQFAGLEFTNGSSSIGGFLYQGTSQGTSLTFTQCAITDCYASGDGGAIYSDARHASSLAFRRCVFSGNQSAINGAVYALVHGNPIDGTVVALFENCLITENTGLGLMRVLNESETHLINCTIAHNDAVKGDPAGYSSYAVLRTHPSTGSDAYARVQNVLLYGNLNGTAASEMYCTGTSDIANVMSDVSSVATSGANIYANVTKPGFVNVTTEPYDYRLAAGSPARDRGMDAGLTEDLDGNARLVAGLDGSGLVVPMTYTAAVDLGAYEAQTAEAPAITYVTPTGTGDGSSWAQAISLTTALAEIGQLSVVYMSEGDYNWSTVSNFASNQLWVGGFDDTTPYTWNPWQYPTNLDAGGLNRHIDMISLTGMQFHGLRFLNGYAASVGAVVVMRNTSEATFSQCTFAGNQGGDGVVLGGPSDIDDIKATFDRCVMTDNVGHYGMQFFHPTDPTVPIEISYTNCLITSNSLKKNIVHMFRGQHRLSIQNCTFANNDVSGEDFSGIVRVHNERAGQDDNRATIENSIFADSTLPGTGGLVLYGSDGAVLDATYCLFDVDDSDAIDSYHTLGAGCLVNANPGFVSDDPLSPDYQLANGSQAVDTGTDNGLAVDITGASRPVAGGLQVEPAFLFPAPTVAYDMGAYEAAAGSVISVGGSTYIAATPRGDMSGDSWDNATSLSAVYDGGYGNAGSVFFLEEGVHLVDTFLNAKDNQIWVGGYDASDHSWDPAENPTIIDVQGLDRLIKLAGPTGLEFAGLTFRNGNGPASGEHSHRAGGILTAYGPTANFTRCGFLSITGIYGGVLSTVHGQAGDGLDLSFDGCLFEDNYNGDAHYGVIARLSDSTPERTGIVTFDNCVISSNSSQSTGYQTGGLFHVDYASYDLQIRNCTVANNNVPAATLIHLNNIDAGENSASIVNTIFADNNSNSVLWAWDRAASITLNSNLFDVALDDVQTTDSLVVDTTNLVSTDPGFINPAVRDYRLFEVSPAIDSAADLGFTADFFGNTRPFDLITAGPDRGAIEMQERLKTPARARNHWALFD